MARIAVSVHDDRLAPRQREGDIEIKSFGNVVKMQTVADGHSIQVALSATDALAVAVQLIDAARKIQKG